MRLLSAIRWIFAAICVIALLAPAGISLVSGWTTVIVDGGSMNPTYAVGDLVFIREPADDETYEVGDVVTALGDDGLYVTHRVHEVVDADTLLLQGDANEDPDGSPIDTSRVRGIVDAHLAQPAANAYLTLMGWPMRICLILIAIGLMLLPLERRGGSRARTGSAASDVLVEETSDAAPLTRRQSTERR